MFLCISMPSKKEACLRFFLQLGIEAQFVDPVLASDLNIEELKTQGTVGATWNRRVPIPRSASCFRFEVACAMSHVKAAQMIVESGANWAFVFEDDNCVKPGCVSKFHDICAWAEEHHGYFNVINVSPCNSMHFRTTGELYKNTQGCTNALLYSRQGAELLLRTIYPISAPIDDWLHCNMPDSFCVHSRIFHQEDADKPLCFTTFWIPLLRKMEYAASFHTIAVWGLLPITAVLSLIWLC